MNSYFSHDSNAKKDPKILKLRMKYGAKGYGIYFMIIEDLRDEEDYSMSKDYDMIAYGLNEDVETVKDVIDNFGLFKFKDGGNRFYSESLNRRMAIKDEISKKKSNAGKKGASSRWNNKKDDTNGTAMAQPFKNDSSVIAQPYQNDGTPNAIAMANDGNKSKVNKSKVNKSKGNYHQEIKENDPKPEVQRRVSSKTDDDDLYRELITFYQQNIGVTSPVVVDNLRYAVADFKNKGTSLKESIEIVKYAIKLTAENNARNWNYTNKILMNWLSSNLFTLVNIKASQKERSNSKNGDVTVNNKSWEDKVEYSKKHSGLAF